MMPIDPFAVARKLGKAEDRIKELEASLAVMQGALQELADIYADVAEASPRDVGNDAKAFARDIMQVVGPALADNPGAKVMAVVEQANKIIAAHQKYEREVKAADEAFGDRRGVSRADMWSEVAALAALERDDG